jgi:hypothetical protein
MVIIAMPDVLMHTMSAVLATRMPVMKTRWKDDIVGHDVYEAGGQRKLVQGVDENGDTAMQRLGILPAKAMVYCAHDVEVCCLISATEC